MFLQAISSVGYSDCSKIKRDIEHLNKVNILFIKHDLGSLPQPLL